MPKLPNLGKLEVDALIALQQKLMEERGETEKEFRTRQQEVQFELDKRAFKVRLGGAPTPAELAALDELRADQKKADVAVEEPEE